MKHVHHDLIVSWAADSSQVVEVHFPRSNTWSATPSPEWREDRQYRFKPEFIVVNGIQVPRAESLVAFSLPSRGNRT